MIVVIYGVMLIGLLISLDIGNRHLKQRNLKQK
jgi:hypothetical protein